MGIVYINYSARGRTSLDIKIKKTLVKLLVVLATLSYLLAQQGPCEKAMRLHQEGQMAAALSEYVVCLQSDPGNIQARSNWGAALAHEGHYAEAIEQDHIALQNAPDSMSLAIRLNLALAFYKGARISEAAKEFETVLRQQPTNRRAAILLAECDLMLGIPAKSIAILQPFQVAAPDDLTVTYLLGSALLQAGDIQGGQQMMDRILSNGDSPEGHMLLGVSMFQAGDYPSAIQEFEKAKTIKPDLPSLQTYYGQALLNTGDADAAIEAFQRELQMNGNSFESNLRLGQIYLARKQFETALPFLTRATQTRPDSVEARDSVVNARNHRVEAPESLNDGPSVGTPAPPFRLQSARSGHPESLTELLQNKPLVAIFGSYTCPQLRAVIPVMNQLHAKFGNQVQFALIYVSEAHGSGSWQSTVNQRDNIDLPTERTDAEKQEHASLCIRKLLIPFQVLVDTMDRSTEKSYAAWPSRIYVIGRDGNIHFQTRLSELQFNRETLDLAISQVAHTR